MDIAALSMAFAGSQVQQQAAVSVMRKSMDHQATAAQTLISDLQAANPPSSNRLDVRA